MEIAVQEPEAATERAVEVTETAVVIKRVIQAQEAVMELVLRMSDIRHQKNVRKKQAAFGRKRQQSHYPLFYLVALQVLLW